jgi:hypothetical protein
MKTDNFADLSTAEIKAIDVAGAVSPKALTWKAVAKRTATALLTGLAIWSVGRYVQMRSA